MEDPVRFDIWCAEARADHDRIVEHLTDQYPHRTHLEVLQAARTAKSDSPVKMWRAVPWAEVERIRANSPIAFKTLQVFQEGYGPELGKTHNCERHDVRYGGTLGCHVCRGFYEGAVAVELSKC